MAASTLADIQTRTVLAQATALKELAQRGNVTDACAAAKVGRTTFYEWLGTDERFQGMHAEAIAIAKDRILGEMWRRGHDGVLEPVYQSGELVGRIRRYSDRLLELLAKAHMPEQFRERFEHSGPKGGPIPIATTIALDDLSDAELSLAEKLLERIEAGKAKALPAEVVHVS